VNFDILADYRPLPHPATDNGTAKAPAKNHAKKPVAAARHKHSAAKPSPDVRSRKECP